jgi:catechol 2,3-dioxygenase-like lactoylglutathione lyase family enzyme
MTLATRLVRRLAAIEVSVANPEDTAEFLRDALDFDVRIGMAGRRDLTAEGDYGVGVPDRMLSLSEGTDLAVEELTFDVDAPDMLDEIATGAAARGLEVRRGEPGDGETALTFVDPWGLPVRCRLPVAPRDAPLDPSDVRPRRLGHVNLKVPEPAAAAAFYCDVLGLRLTEQLGDRLFFLRVAADHHNLAFRPANETNVHHIAFEVAGWDNFRVICDHMAARGHQIEYGPGRHAPGHQLFIYVTDPISRLRVEVFADMARIDDEAGYQPIRREIDRVRSLNVWGPAPPPSFLE